MTEYIPFQDKWTRKTKQSIIISTLPFMIYAILMLNTIIFILIIVVLFILMLFVRYRYNWQEKRTLRELDRITEKYHGKKENNGYAIDDFYISIHNDIYNFFIVYPSKQILGIKVKYLFFSKTISVNPELKANDKAYILKEVEDWLEKNKKNGFRIGSLWYSTGKIIIELHAGHFNGDDLIKFLRSTKNILQSRWMIAGDETQFEELKD